MSDPKFSSSDMVTTGGAVGHILGRYWDFDAETVVYYVEWNGTTTRKMIPERKLNIAD